MLIQVTWSTKGGVSSAVLWVWEFCGFGNRKVSELLRVLLRFLREALVLQVDGRLKSFGKFKLKLKQNWDEIWEL